MRKILFRGKRISDNTWVYGGIMKTFHPNFAHESGEAFVLQKENCYCICANGKDYFVEQESIGQYTGLCDKNGKKIFEGDVVQFEDNNYVVRRECDTPGGYWAETGYILDHIGWNDYIHFTDTIDEYNNEICVEVIGNIHDNPELLRKEDKGK